MVGQSSFPIPDLQVEKHSADDFIRILIELHVARLEFARGTISTIEKSNNEYYEKLRVDKAMQRYLSLHPILTWVSHMGEYVHLMITEQDTRKETGEATRVALAYI